MTFSAPLGVSLVAIIWLSSTISVKAQNYGIGSNFGLGPLGNFGSSFSFNPGPRLQPSSSTTTPNEEPSSNAGHGGDYRGPDSTGPPTEGTTTQSGGIGINSNLGLGPLGSIGSGFNFFGKPKKEPTSTTPSQEPSPSAANREGYGLNTNLGLGKAGSVGSGINYNKGGATAAPAQSTTTQADGYGINSNLGLGPLGSIGSGFNFFGKPKEPSSTTPSQEPSADAADRGDIGLNSNLGLGKAGSVGSGISYSKAGATSAPAQSTTTQANGYGINSNLGLGPLGSVGSGFNFGGPRKEPSSTAPSQEPSNRGDIGLNTNLGLGKAGSVGSGINFNKAGATAAPAQSTTSQGNGIGINSNLGLGPLGSVGSGFNFQTPAKSASTTTSSGLRAVNDLVDSNDTSSTTSNTSLTTSIATETTTTTVAKTDAPKWSNWTEWSTCTVSCGIGQEKRSRTCGDSDKTCFGHDKEQRACFNKPCPQGKWTEWSEWSNCTTTCGFGQQHRSRTCEGGACFGPAEMQRLCPFKAC